MHAHASQLATRDELDARSRSAFYRRVMSRLNDAGVPFLVGGAYALARYTGIERNTKDFDIFVRRDDYRRVHGSCSTSGDCRTEFTFPHWLGKALCGDDFVDIIFSSGNAVATVDDEWFAHAPKANVLGLPARLSPAEEMIWSKAFIMERERFDGADVLHLLLRCGRVARLAAAAAPLRPALARAALAPRDVRLRLPGRARRRFRTWVMDAPARAPADARCASRRAQPSASAAARCFARAVPDRHRAVGLRGCAPGPAGLHERRRSGALDRSRDRSEQART